ncbi:DegT/DnrJ/EryC1/StrS family aminotransferase [Phycicoccus duodecadis]|uniref:dTDP-4-amino-4,6-dideoxygalactose transaminase n=1 Tax=Phycicoccus duodecadis TaxID=173053 RepID=A0A2N3YEL4_9MICO|nr:DegT/DnrJ/EryC1/StrS aminotransferase family protein [Phycicoccus duodecadis]PKW25281.1 dTDP-4-amino-4,6-dideoxygalactose transaminase [Phycicoccus duodecadis]
MIPLTVPLIEDDDLAVVAEVLRSGNLVQGRNVAAFEAAVAAQVGVPHAVAVANGTAALHLALLALGVGPGDAVAVPTYSWPATANVVEAVGADCVFVDIEEGSWAMSPARLAEVDVPLAAVLPVHPFGVMADLAALAAAAPGVPVVEDAACALGAGRDGRAAGSVGTMGCFSFHPRKAVTTGEGGMVTTSSAELDVALRRWRNHGIHLTPGGSDFVLPGLNYRLTDMQGALGVTQMAKLERVVGARRAAADVYAELLAGTPLAAPAVIASSEPVHQSYVAVLPEGVDRAALIPAAAERGVQIQIGTVDIPSSSYYRDKYGFGPGRFPVTEAWVGRHLSLPLYPGITREQQETVVSTVVGLL